MPPGLDFIATPVWTFVLVLARISGLFMLAPMFGSAAVPRRVRALFAASIALLITATFLPSSQVTVHNLVELTLLVGKEAALGLILAVSLMICFAGIQISGQMLSHLGGLSVGDLFDPNTNTSVPILSQLLWWTAVAMFLVSGGHRRVMGALLDLFHVFPPGEVALPDNLLQGIIDVMALSFETALRIAAPVLVALLLSMLVLGLIGRTLPQLNILAVGLGTNTLIMLAGLFLTAGTMLWVFQQQQDAILGMLQAWLHELPLPAAGASP